MLSATTYAQWCQSIRSCVRCGLCKTRTMSVPGVRCTATRPTLMLIGEAPGKNEDRKGTPFCGASGEELVAYLERARLTRNICDVDNVVKCRPPDDRDPTPDEIAKCRGYVESFVRSRDPHLVVLVGRIAAKTFLGDRFDSMERDHGIPVEHAGRLWVPVYHPADGMHQTHDMALIQQDFHWVKEILARKRVPEDFIDRFPSPEYARVAVPASLRDFLGENVSTIALDTEIDSTLREGHPWCLSASTRPGTGCVVRATDTAGLGYVNEIVSNPRTLTILHNAKFDLPVLAKLGVRPARFWDSMLAAYVLQIGAIGLKVLAYRIAGMKMTEYNETIRPYAAKKYLNYVLRVLERDWPKPEPEAVIKDGVAKVYQAQGVNQRLNRALTDLVKNPDVDLWDRWVNVDAESRKRIEAELGPLTRANISDIPLDEAVQYAARDADATLRIYPVLSQMVHTEGLDGVLDVDIGVVPMVADMEQHGMPVDLGEFAKLSEEYAKRLREQEKVIHRMVGYPVLLSSPAQVSELLYKKLNLHTRVRTKSGGDSTGEKALSVLKDKHPVVPLILTHRSLDKLKCGFIDAIPKLTVDGMIHSDLSITRTYTGRLASSEPNLMNIPTRSMDGKRIRNCFIAPPGKTFIAGDYSQIEMRMAAHMSKDPFMCKVFLTGQDIHEQTASAIFGIPVAQLDKMKHRYPAKRVGFGILYQIGPESLYDQLVMAGCEGWSVDKCRELIREWFRVYKGVRAYFNAKQAEARRTGMVRDCFGRLYRIPEIRSSQYWIRGEGERKACSYPIQGGAQGVEKRGMMKMQRVAQSWRKAGYYCWPVLQIHDDLLFLVDEAIRDGFCAQYEQVMENVVQLRVPVLLETQSGSRWGQMVEEEEDGYYDAVGDIA